MIRTSPARGPAARGLPMLALAVLQACGSDAPRSIPTPAEFHGALIAPRQVDAALLSRLKREDYDTVILQLAEGVSISQSRSAALAVIAAGLSLGYWIEVGRSPTLAQTHPEWVATLPLGDQGTGRASPWVPIDAPAPLRAQLLRVADLLRDQLAADVVLLNDLQGAPAACGCRNALCPGRPARDPGFVAGAAADFVAQVDGMLPRSRVVPVWAGHAASGRDGTCCSGECQAAEDAQWQRLVSRSATVGVLLPGGGAGLRTEPLATLARSNPGVRLVPVLSVWEASDPEILRQIRSVTAAGARGHVVALTGIEQSVDTPARAGPR